MYLAHEFFETTLLKTFGDTNGKKVQRRLMGIFEYIAKHGDSPRMSGERGHIHGIKWDFSRKLIRIACFKHGDAWILTHGFFKQGAKKKLGDWTPEHLDRADRIREEHLAYMQQENL